MIIHWGEQGNPDGYGSKFMGLWMMPLMLIGIYVLMSVIPYIAVFKANLKSFYRYYYALKTVFVVFFLSFYIIQLLQNLGHQFNITYFMVPWIGIMFIIIGYIIKFAKRNFFIGIRTPWTLANDTVWKKTHDLGSKIFIGIGIIVILSILVPNYSFYVLMITIFGGIIYMFVYSYLEYRKIERKVGEKGARKL